MDSTDTILKIFMNGLIMLEVWGLSKLLDKVKKLSFESKDNEKKLLKKQFIKNFKNFTAGIIMNNKLDSNQNEVYLYISNQNEIVSKLLYKTYQSKIKSNIYYFYLKLILFIKNTESLFQYFIK